MKTPGYIDIKGEDLKLVLAKMCFWQEKVSLNQSLSLILAFPHIYSLFLKYFVMCFKCIISFLHLTR